jgi:tetratricopeptide (TPR) repeat protein
MTSVAEALDTATKHQRAGDFGRAEPIYRQIVQADPSNAVVWRLLGETYHALNRPAEASASYQQALRFRPDFTDQFVKQGAEFADQGKLDEAAASYLQALRLQPGCLVAHFNLGNVYSAQGKGPQAVACFRQAVRLKPDNCEALAGLGVALAKQGQLSEAVAHLRQAIQLKPDYAKAHHNLGVAYAELRDLDQAAASLREAIRLKPDYVEAHFNLANTLVEMNKREDALPIFRRALELKPDYIDALNNFGLALCETGKLAESAVLLRQAVRLKPDHTEALNNLGLTLAEQGLFDEAIATYDRALRINPRYAEAHTNMGSAYKEQGRLDEAIACYDYALWLQPDAASTHWNRALTRLQMGDFERGWAEYEWRWKRKRGRPRPFTQPLWDGSPLEGRTILLYMEQGLGDMMMFVRYAPSVQRRGGKVVVECPDILLPLFSSLKGVDQLVAEKCDLPPFDVQAPLMSLPYLLKTTLATVPAEVPYFSAPPDLIERWRDRLAQYRTFKIGITWQGNPHHKWDRHRSMPLAQFAPLAAVPGVQLFSLQKGDGVDQLRALAGAFPVTELTETLDADTGVFVETGAVMKNLDLVITADTAIAHLAGALAVPVWVLLSTIMDWRWMRKRQDTPWYPTMRLFGQQKLGDWEPVFARMADEVRALAARCLFTLGANTTGTK